MKYVSSEWTPSGFGGLQHLNFRQDSSGFSLHADAHGIIVRLGEFARLEFEVQVAQVLIDHFLALVEICNPGLFGAGIRVAVGQEDVDQYARGKDAAENLYQDKKYLRVHISVSRWARWRRASRCGSRLASVGTTGAVGSFQL